MAYFRKTAGLTDWLDHIEKSQKWLIVINADPDAMASAMALKRILRTRCPIVDIANINEITRPDNLAMIRYTRIKMKKYNPKMLQSYTHFGIVDSQPSHNVAFEGIPFSIIIDHHPIETEEKPNTFYEIKPEYGATSTMLTEYLYNLNIRPGKLLSTALRYGIQTDTASFQRHASEIDMRAFQYLGKFSNHQLLGKIARSEYLIEWLPFFAKATTNMHKAKNGHFVYIGEVDSPDILVVIADFFTRVYEIRWIAIAGYYDDTVVLVFRSDGTMDVGAMAHSKFQDLGSGGGHKMLARAEFPLSSVKNENLENFLYERLLTPMHSE